MQMFSDKDRLFFEKERKGQKWRITAAIVFLLAGILNHRTEYLYSFFGELGFIATGFYLGLSLTALALYLNTKRYLSIFRGN